MVVRTIIAVVILVVIFGGTFSWDAIRAYLLKDYFAHYEPPPVTVSTVKAKAETWYPTLLSVGTLEALNGVDVNSRVDGQVVGIYFKSGQMVKKDQPLVQLDDSLDWQSLKNDKAALRYNTLNYKRLLSVYKTTNGTSKNDVDQALSQMQQSQAAVATDELNIQYKNIKAPFTGKLGIRKVNIGQYITTGTALVTLQALDPLFVDFSLPQQDLAKLYVNQPIQIQTDSYPDKKFTGKIMALSSKVDTDTRTILVRATIPNPNYKLLPGLFTNVYVQLPQEQQVITVPQTAITYTLYGDSVFVVTEKGKDKENKPLLIANQRYVTVGLRKGTVVEIKKGLQAGEIVVQSGQIKLQNGSRVQINNRLELNKSVQDQKTNG